MALIKISTDGTEFEIKDDIARDDQRLREALTPFYPEMANAEITRSEQDGKFIVTMAKRAGTKGFSRSDALTVLRSAIETINPAVLMQDKLRQMEERGELDVRKLIIGLRFHNDLCRESSQFAAALRRKHCPPASSPLPFRSASSTDRRSQWRGILYRLRSAQNHNPSNCGRGRFASGPSALGLLRMLA